MLDTKIEKVLLIWPYYERKSFSATASSYELPPPRFPLGIGYIAAYLRKAGIDVEILDCCAEGFSSETIVGDKVRVGLSDLEITQRIEAYNPQLVGVSQMFTYLMPCCEHIFSLVKQYNNKYNN